MGSGGKGTGGKTDKGGKGQRGPLKSRRGFGHGVRKVRRRLSNTAIKGLLGSELFTDAILEFLRSTRVGTIKEWVALNKG